MNYFDNAATSHPKPLCVKQAMLRAIEKMTSPGRGEYAAATLAQETVFNAREAVGGLLGISNPEQIVFTYNATHSLNIAIKGLLKNGGRVVISGYEHNAVTRPLAVLKERGDVSIFVASSNVYDPEDAVQAYIKALNEGADCAVCCHVSNVFGYVLPVERIAAVCEARGVPFIIDASQSAGVEDIDLSKIKCAFLCAPGHKALYGPQGTGILICADESIEIPTLIEGGTGGDSIRQTPPDYPPERFESGTLNIPGIAGLCAGVNFVRKTGVSVIREYELSLAKRFISQLEKRKDIEVFRDPTFKTQAGVVSFRPVKGSIEELTEKLGKRGFALRSGLHCAPLAHSTVGTLDTGTLRASFSIFNHCRDVDMLTCAIKSLL